MFGKPQTLLAVRAITLAAVVMSVAACSQYAQSARSDAMQQSPAVAASLVDAAASARHNYQKQASEWANLLAKGTDKTALATHVKGFGDSAINVQKDLAQTRKILVELQLPTQKLDALKAAHQEMVLSQFEAFNAQYDKTGADPLAQRKVEKAVQGIDSAFASDMDQFLADIANHSLAQR